MQEEFSVLLCHPLLFNLLAAISYINTLRISDINVYNLVHVTDRGLYTFRQFLRVIAR